MTAISGELDLFTEPEVVDTSAALAFVYDDNPVRVTMVAGEPWWVAKDVCDVLGITRTNDALSGLDDDEKGAATIRNAQVSAAAKNVTTASRALRIFIVLSSLAGDCKPG